MVGGWMDVFVEDVSTRVSDKHFLLFENINDLDKFTEQTQLLQQSD